MAFQGNKFIFDGVPGETYGLILANIEGAAQSVGNIGGKLTIHEDRINGRATGLDYGATANEALSFPISLVSVEDNHCFSRYDVAAIAGWLTGHHDFKDLIILQEDMENVHYRCRITQLVSVEVGMRIIGFTATVTCDGPYAYLAGSADTIQAVCSDCGSSGYLPCVICGGQGITNCRRCGGSGTIRCTNCSGTGTLLLDGAEVPCGACGGSGSSVCQTCGGGGVTECTRCVGSGYGDPCGCGGSTLFYRRYVNRSNVNDYYRPKITIRNQRSDLTIRNLSDHSTFQLTGLPQPDVRTITIDCLNQVMTASDGINLYQYWNKDIVKQFPRFVRGENELELEGVFTMTVDNDVPWNIGN